MAGDGGDILIQDREQEFSALAEAIATANEAKVAEASVALLSTLIGKSSVVASAGVVFGQWLVNNPDNRLQQAAEIYSQSARAREALGQFAALIGPLLFFALHTLQSVLARIGEGQPHPPGAAIEEAATGHLEARLESALRGASGRALDARSAQSTRRKIENALGTLSRQRSLVPVPPPASAQRPPVIA